MNPPFFQQDLSKEMRIVHNEFDWQCVASQPSPIPVPSLRGIVPLVPSGPEAPAWSTVAAFQTGRGTVLKPDVHRVSHLKSQI